LQANAVDLNVLGSRSVGYKRTWIGLFVHLNRAEGLADKHDSRFQRNPSKQILDVIVYQSNATRSYEMTNGFRRIRAVDEQARLVQQQCACTQQTAGAAG
jgi:hypothetical protein